MRCRLERGGGGGGGLAEEEGGGFAWCSPQTRPGVGNELDNSLKDAGPINTTSDATASFIRTGVFNETPSLNWLILRPK